MKITLSIFLLLSAIHGFAMDKTIKNRHRNELIQTASDNAFCPYGKWGSSDGEPVDARIPKEWNRSAGTNSKNEQEKLLEAIHVMQQVTDGQYLQNVEKCCCAASFIGLSTLIFYSCFYGKTHQ